MPQDNQTAPTLPAQDDLSADAIEQYYSDRARGAAPLEEVEFVAEAPPLCALTEAQLLMRETLPPLPMVGGIGALLALAGGHALDSGDAIASERCSATEYHDGGATDDLRATDTEQVPAFHFEPIAHMSDDQVASELAALTATEGATVERRILLYLARRHFTLGLAAYGPVRLHDGRDNRNEMREEAADFLFYFAKEQLEQETR